MNKYVKKVLKKRAEDDLSFLDFQNTFNTEEAPRIFSQAPLAKWICS
jgi:hypothetical protein